ncbi:MAG TPA: hypothetical protein VEA41_09550, partial [Salinarimonas sp.]|nr:hypothetical protein [Salinarimonas sp.]
ELMPRIWIWRVRFALLAALVVLVNFHAGSRDEAPVSGEFKGGVDESRGAGTEAQGPASGTVVLAKSGRKGRAHSPP